MPVVQGDAVRGLLEQRDVDGCGVEDAPAVDTGGLEQRRLGVEDGSGGELLAERAPVHRGAVRAAHVVGFGDGVDRVDAGADLCVRRGAHEVINEGVLGGFAQPIAAHAALSLSADVYQVEHGTLRADARDDLPGEVVNSLRCGRSGRREGVIAGGFAGLLRGCEQPPRVTGNV